MQMAKDKIFVGCGQSIHGFTRKGKEWEGEWEDGGSGGIGHTVDIMTLADEELQKIVPPIGWRVFVHVFSQCWIEGKVIEFVQFLTLLAFAYLCEVR